MYMYRSTNAYQAQGGEGVSNYGTARQTYDHDQVYHTTVLGFALGWTDGICRTVVPRRRKRINTKFPPSPPHIASYQLRFYSSFFSAAPDFISALAADFFYRVHAVDSRGSTGQFQGRPSVLFK